MALWKSFVPDAFASFLKDLTPLPLFCSSGLVLQGAGSHLGCSVWSEGLKREPSHIFKILILYLSHHLFTAAPYCKVSPLVISEIHGYLPIYKHVYTHPMHRAAVNTNQWVQCAELQAQKVFKSVPSRFKAVNLRVYHIARAISISK